MNYVCVNECKIFPRHWYCVLIYIWYEALEIWQFVEVIVVYQEYIDILPIVGRFSLYKRKLSLLWLVHNTELYLEVCIHK